MKITPTAFHESEMQHTIPFFPYYDSKGSAAPGNQKALKRSIKP
jgi:hypothetical protein